jgi:plastocyanin
MIATILTIITFASAATFNIVAGQGGLRFSQPTITIQVGDTITWQFGASPHSVTQVSDGTSCIPLAGGFDSGSQTSTTYTRTFQQAGVFYYVCTVGSHCQAGMRGIVTVENRVTTTAVWQPMTTTVAITTTSQASKPVQTHTIQVAPGGQLGYSIPSLDANVGDVVIWKFAGAPHTVTETGDGQTCVPKQGGFDSGALTGATTEYRQTLNRSGKVWYVCTVGAHCAAGMKGVINVAGGTTGSQTPPTTGSSGSGASSNFGVGSILYTLLFVIII